MRCRFRALTALCGLALLSSFSPARADEALVAVAANFKDAIDELAADFEENTGHEVTIVVGSTGKLFAQIVNGAPFDVLLAADQERPLRLEQEGKAAPGSRFTYAVGRLTLWSADPGFIGEDGEAVLRNVEFRKLAIANPDLAPYGVAAMDVLAALELSELLRPKIVTGEDVGQTFAMVATGNAELGFVALSYVLSRHNKTVGSRWDPPAGFYKPIKQDAVLLSRAAENVVAAAFLDYLKSDEARATIARSGYGSD